MPLPVAARTRLTAESPSAPERHVVLLNVRQKERVRTAFFSFYQNPIPSLKLLLVYASVMQHPKIRDDSTMLIFFIYEYEDEYEYEYEYEYESPSSYIKATQAHTGAGPGRDPTPKGGGGDPPPPLRTPKLSYGTMCFVSARGAGDFVLGIGQGEIFLFDPMCLYSKYSEFRGEFKNG